MCCGDGFRITYMLLLFYILLYFNTHAINVSAVKALILESQCIAGRPGYITYKLSNKISHFSGRVSSKSSESDDFHTKLHEEALEAREFQLQIPPTTDDKLVKIPELIDSKDEGLQAGETDVLKLVDKGIIPEFRHPKTTEAESNLLSWYYDRPPDVYLIKFEGVLFLSPRESAVIAYNAASKLLDPSHEFTSEIPLYFYHLLLHSLPYIISKIDYMLAALKYLTTLHDKIDYKRIGEAIDHLRRANESSDPFQPFCMYTGSSKRSRPFMMAVTTDVLGVKDFVARNKSLFKSLDLKDFNYSASDLVDAYNLQQGMLESLDSWNEVFLYRNSIPISDESVDRFHQLTYNYAAAQAILHHIKVWRMPVYIVSKYYTRSELSRRVSAILESVSGDGVGESSRYISYHTVANDGDLWLSEIVSGISGKLSGVVPVHVFSDRYSDLNGLPNSLNLHFVDWGHSTYEEKLTALYSPDMNYMNHTKQLVSAMALPSTNAGRCWEHGYQLLPPISEVGKFLESWKRRWEMDEEKPYSRPPCKIG